MNAPPLIQAATPPALPAPTQVATPPPECLASPTAIEEGSSQYTTPPNVSPLNPDIDFSALEPGHISDEKCQLIDKGLDKIYELFRELALSTGSRTTVRDTHIYGG